MRFISQVRRLIKHGFTSTYISSEIYYNKQQIISVFMNMVKNFMQSLKVLTATTPI